MPFLYKQHLIRKLHVYVTPPHFLPIASFAAWDAAVQCLSVLDVLISLATYSCSADGVMCRPEFHLSEQPFLDIKNGRHPCIVRTYSGDDFIPNDVTVGMKEVRIFWCGGWVGCGCVSI